MRQFLIVKRQKQEGEEDMEIIDVLEKVEKSLNDLSDHIETLEGGSKVVFTFDTTDVEKKGARFSKDTIATLRSLKGAIDKLLNESSEEDKDVSKEDAVSALTKGIQASLEKKEEKKEDIGEIIKNALVDALKSVKE